MPLSPMDFRSTRTFSRLTRLPSPSEISVQMFGKPVTYDLNPLMPGLKNVRLWTGTVTSNSIAVPSDCR